MKVVGYCLQPAAIHLGLPVQDWLPAIPIGLLTTDGYVWRSEPVPQHQFKQQALPTPMEVPEGAWLGVESSGSCTVLPPDEEPEWRVQRATGAIQESIRVSQLNALRSVSMLHAAATLVGLRMPELHSKLAQARKSPGEPLEVTVRALAAELAKNK